MTVALSAVFLSNYAKQTNSGHAENPKTLARFHKSMQLIKLHAGHPVKSDAELGSKFKRPYTNVSSLPH